MNGKSNKLKSFFAKRKAKRIEREKRARAARRGWEWEQEELDLMEED